MTLLRTFEDFASRSYDAVERTVFLKSMEERINDPERGYKMQDLIYDVYICQNQIANLKMALCDAGLMERIPGDPHIGLRKACPVKEPAEKKIKKEAK